MTVQKWYVVWSGRAPGIYTSWDDAKAQVHGFQGARYQSFKTKWAADEAFSTGPDTFQDLRQAVLPDIISNSISVDAACSGNPGVVEYQGVYTATKTRVFHKKIDGLGTNNGGEFLALVHALSWQKGEGLSLPIYSDSDVAIGWVKRKKSKTTLKKTPQTMPMIELMNRAEIWLTENSLTWPIHKWLTKDWGEIPADFGRKQ
ncbi:MAG: viroplasmin family protein [Candidatus Marinamargulisbacteria bacterium]